MEITLQEDVEVPLDALFAKLSDFNKMERLAMRQGVDVQRNGAGPALGPGLGWNAEFAFRGKKRRAEITLTDFEPPNAMRFKSRTGGIESEMTVDLVALSRKRTRMRFSGMMTAKTLSARLLLQSARLARGRLEGRLKKRFSGFAQALEEGRI